MADEYMASKWACKYRGKINGSFVSTYRLDANNLNIYTFSLDQEWLDFVVTNRNGKSGDPKFKEYDILIGAMVDDNHAVSSDYKEAQKQRDNLIRKDT